MLQPTTQSKGKRDPFASFPHNEEYSKFKKRLCKPKRNYDFKAINNFQGVLPFYNLFGFKLSLIIHRNVY